ncbi:pilin [Halobaculum saliterrae]|uniref:pilin n=1 Tax=Halobaculum saliterrae TaxID=2073113 RepID=UPI00191690B9|nr:pilin [Halobaculum saliterrae]
MPRKIQFVTAITALILTASAPASASHGTLKCEVPSSLLPLFDLLHTLTDVAFLMGVGLATLGFTVAGILIAGPFGDDYTQHGKRTVKRVFIGTVLLLSAGMIVSFLTSQMGGTFCT